MKSIIVVFCLSFMYFSEALNATSWSHSVLRSRSGREYFAFTSIPYAKPPVGELRFSDPVPVDLWTGVGNAGNVSPPCTQIYFYITYLQNKTMGQEDCLYLNVYTPKLNAKLPVMVYIHGGGFRCGYPGPSSRAQYFMDEDVVLVQVAYRLGVLGFLSTEDEVIPGNFGLKDQALALKWIKENIESFGGDSNSITLFGESAGAASVHYHLMSPISKDLFHRAILQSGSNCAFWAWDSKGLARQKALKISQHLKCPTSSHTKMLECLRTKSNTELTEAEHIFNFVDSDPVVLFKPVIDDYMGENAFVPTHPLHTETSKPIIIGVTSAEGIFKTAFLLHGDGKALKWYEENADSHLPQLFMYEDKTSDVTELTQKISEFYGIKKPLNLDAIRDVFSDMFMVWPSVLTIRKHKGPAYYYLFDHRGEVSLTDALGNKDLGNLGVCHADELIYLFNIADIIKKMKGTEEDKIVSRKLIRLWYNFANTGKPFADGIGWEKYGSSAEYLHISSKGFVMKKHFMRNTVKFWDSLTPLFLSEMLHSKDEL